MAPGLGHEALIEGPTPTSDKFHLRTLTHDTDAGKFMGIDRNDCLVMPVPQR